MSRPFKYPISRSLFNIHNKVSSLTLQTN
jgi:hypothetical protein